MVNTSQVNLHRWRLPHVSGGLVCLGVLPWMNGDASQNERTQPTPRFREGQPSLSWFKSMNMIIQFAFRLVPSIAAPSSPPKSREPLFQSFFPWKQSPDSFIHRPEGIWFIPTIPWVIEFIRLPRINSCLNGIKEQSGYAWPWEKGQLCWVKPTKLAYFGTFWPLDLIFKGKIDLRNVARMSDCPNFDSSPVAQRQNLVFLAENLMP